MNENKKKKVKEIAKTIQMIEKKAFEMEEKYHSFLEKVDPSYKDSAKNLVHYLAFRSFDTSLLQKYMRSLGLSSLTSIEGHVMQSLINVQDILNHMSDDPFKAKSRGLISSKKSEKLLTKNTNKLFGNKPKNRGTRIMVTLPVEAAENLTFVRKLILSGMNCARINCAHYDVETWDKMINNVKKASSKLGRKCKIAMDLGGPKIRTGSMLPGPKVIHVKPDRDDFGRVVHPAYFWIAPANVPPPPHSIFDAILPVSATFYQEIKRGSIIHFKDARGKKGKIHVIRKEGGGKWGISQRSLYLKTGTEIQLHELYQEGGSVSRIGELEPKEQIIRLCKGDILDLHKDPIPGEPALYNDEGKLLKKAHISCTLPQVFDDITKGETVFFNDGKIEGIVIKKDLELIEIRITQASDKGSKLRSDKGINFPDSNLQLTGLTQKDKEDLEFVAHQADIINLSFVNTQKDVTQLQESLKQKDSKAGIILKIETQKAFSNLPQILLTAMQSYPVGIMIARGDLAIETGWKNFASIQQEIMRICEAAHIPDVWATQVLESLAKKGTPSRAEITDAAMSQHAQCVMLNKGPYIHKAVRMLDKILKRMQKFQDKNSIILPKLDNAEDLILSHKRFDV